MEPTTQPQRTEGGRRSGPEPRVVAIEFRPAPDAEARLRRIATILVDHATRTAAQEAEEMRSEVQ